VPDFRRRPVGFAAADPNFRYHLTARPAAAHARVFAPQDAAGGPQEG
jgi:hypothetical protein